MFREAQATVAEAARRGMPIDEVAGERTERAGRRHTRRTFLKAAAGGLAGAGLGAVAMPRARATTGAQPTIVVVGGGLAGIACAWQLYTTMGWTSTVYEGSTIWPSGRCVTLRGAPGGWLELCGEFVSSEHCRMRALAQRFASPGPRGDGLIYTTGGQKLFFADADGDGNNDGYTWGTVNDPPPLSVCNDWQTFAFELFNSGVMSCPVGGGHTQPACSSLDGMSAEEWISTNVDPVSPNLARLLRLTCVAENAGEPSDQSALDLLYLLGYDTSSCASPPYQAAGQPLLAGTDEDYQIWQGNDQVLTGMLGELPPGTLELGYTLTSVVCNSAQSYTLTFDCCGGGSTTVTADQVVLAVPFKTLRKVDLSNAQISSLKMSAIKHLGMGANAKVFTQMTGKWWESDGSGGNGYIDLPAPGAPTVAQSTWPSFEPGVVGAPPWLVSSFGGQAGMAGFGTTFGVDSAEGSAPQAMISSVLGVASSAWRRIGDYATSTGYYHWPWKDALIGGSWSYYRVGQVTTLSGVVALPEGPGQNLHFAGEHTSTDFQGFMEGAVESGYRAAAEILSTAAPAWAYSCSQSATTCTPIST
jgi:monoamine oxidase